MTLDEACLREQIEEMIEFSSAVVIVASVPVNFRALLTAVERLKHFERSVVHGWKDFSTVLCDSLSIVTRPQAENFAMLQFDLRELFSIAKKANQLVGNVVASFIFQSYHVEL
jgi:hypothetical protein